MRWGWLLLGVLVLPTAALGQSRDQVIDRAGSWTLKCDTDPMTDKRSCRVGTEFSVERPTLISAAFFASTDGTVFAVVDPLPRLVRVRVDQAAAVELPCSRGICAPTKADGAQFLAKLRKGGSLLVDISTYRGALEWPRTIGLTGFDGLYHRGLAEAKKR